MKIIVFILFYSFIHFLSCAQSDNKLDYFIKDNDTTFCTSISVISNDKKEDLEYTDQEGNKQIILDAKTNNITTISINGQIFDLLGKDKSSELTLGYYWRKINGKIKIYDSSSIKIYHFGNINGNVDTNPGTESSGGNNFLDMYLMFDNGEIIYLKNNKTIDEKIKPVVEKCDKFTEKYKGEYKLKDVEKIVKFYNNFCDE
ncbi:MAG: hypothetical protein V1904_07305 [Bacteroidota bacterium]